MLEIACGKVRKWKRDPEDVTSITPEGLKQTQEAWVRYRDACVEFGRIHYPAVTSEAWQVWLDRDRLRMLEYLIVYELP